MPTCERRCRPAFGRFNWHFDGCPHTGGSLEARGEQLYATVWTGAPEHLGAYVLRSNDGGGTWSVPYRLGGTHARHTDLAVGTGNQLLAVWDAFKDDTLTIQMAVSNDSGDNWEPPILLRQSRFTLAQPRTVAVDSGFAVFWLEGKPEGGAVLACLPIP